MNPYFSIAFYNLENLFDPEDGEHTLDKNYTPDGIFGWNENRYRQKIENLGLAISMIGSGYCKTPPLFLGVCEVENQRCLRDLVQSRALLDHGYEFIHYESEDRRGLDTAFLFQKRHFKVKESRPFRTAVHGKSGEEATRDILYVAGDLFSERLHILVNHWPSRLDGSRSTQSKRRQMALELKRIVDSIYSRDPHSKILVVGDFNDEPNDRSLRMGFSHDFRNTLLLREDAVGTMRYRKKWVLFDQILLNENLLSGKSLIYKDSRVFHPSFLVQNKGRHKGSPRRSFLGRFHQGGYSDHFPVYALFEAVP